MKTTLFIDYENVQNVALTQLAGKNLDIKLFVGNLQNKIPFSIVNEAQSLGDKLEWIKIEGQGKNALDFHIAFFLGYYSSQNDIDEFIILSKDKGYDPLVKYLNSRNTKCRRINSILELTSTRTEEAQFKDEKFNKVLENLNKIPKQKRPRKRNTLRKHIKSLFNNKIEDNEVDSIIDHMFIREQVSEMNHNISYNM